MSLTHSPWQIILPAFLPDQLSEVCCPHHSTVHHVTFQTGCTWVTVIPKCPCCVGHVVNGTDENGRHMTPVTCLHSYCAQCSAPKHTDTHQRSDWFIRLKLMLCTHYLCATNSMQQSRLVKLVVCQPVQNSPLLCYQKVYYSVKQDPPPVPIVSQTNTIQIQKSVSVRFILILFSHLRLDFSSGINGYII
jgi:hypothetical protein